MKVIYLYILLLLLIISCNDSSIYVAGSEWVFTARNPFNNILDTITLKIFDEPWLATQKKMNWIFIKKDSNKSISIVSETGVIDRRENLINKIFNMSEIELPPPSNEYLEYAELVPSPYIRFPIIIGESIIKEYTFKKGWEGLKNKKVNGKIKVTGKIFYNNPVINDSCWTLDAIGKSSIGTFKAKYYFHETKGFVYFYYDFNKYQVVMELISTK